MIIAKVYSFNGGEKFINDKYPHLLKEIKDVINLIDAETCRLKVPAGKEAHRLIKIGEEELYSPIHLNALFDYYLHSQKWYLKPRITTNDHSREGFREMDAIKGKLGIEIQFGKYAFLTYDIVAKMVIFKNFEVIDSGIEICPMASMLPHLSSGIGSFEQVIWDLDHRGAVPGFDVPVLIIGIETQKTREQMRIRKAREYTANQVKIDRVPILNAGTIRKVIETGIEIKE